MGRTVDETGIASKMCCTNFERAIVVQPDKKIAEKNFSGGMMSRGIENKISRLSADRLQMRSAAV
jgi:hypothetical protein